MFRKITIIAALFSFSLAIPCAVLAGDATSSTTRREKVREKVEVVKEKMSTREAALKAKLAAFKDKRKAEIADRVNTSLNQINKKQTVQMLKYLDNMSALLGKLEKRVDSGSPDVKNADAAKVAIADAKAAIESAKSAVSAQADKDYTLTVTTESRVKADAQKVREALHTDLKTLRQQVIDAKKAVADAIRTAKSGRLPVSTGSALRKEGTASGRR